MNIVKHALFSIGKMDYRIENVWRQFGIKSVDVKQLNYPHQDKNFELEEFLKWSGDLFTYSNTNELKEFYNRKDVNFNPPIKK